MSAKRYPDLKDQRCAYCDTGQAEYQLPHCDWGFCAACRQATIEEATAQLPVVEALVAAGGGNIGSLFGVEDRRRAHLHARKVRRPSPAARVPGRERGR